MAHMLLLMLTAFAAVATDVTGTWTGTLTPEGGAPTAAVLVLRQEGRTLTGTAGGSDDESHPIRHGTIENDVIAFEIERQGEKPMTFELRVSDGELTGTVVRERGGQKQMARLLVKRTK